ncbi:hypothetical protein [Streptomyces europaeiscabiei]|uniref:hypothetical protein n=1 Tax=Streptomyces europaeiscabiei TaxID=146819 RepID=UPI0029A60835|nr:hypothetical protein [Streptomyces europaeiscabiei]MDX2759667.1 hypothetical protein [Streptomyces europaeiscabiei]
MPISGGSTANSRTTGGWDVHFLHWMPVQSAEWRGVVALGALHNLREHGRL